ncbi:MAG: type II toxin-antitoxin system VapC family toxin [Methylovulum sp.]|nr:type II toxin-antitoxin system VapC family toxin [Methylovulum sp.]
MILLDTNIISELMRQKPNPAVIGWLDGQYTYDLFIPAIVKAEIETGIAILDDGKRKQTLSKAAEFIFANFFNRCLPFDGNTASHYASIIAFAKKQGRPMSVEDAQIASIAIQHQASLATRNVADFDFLVDLTLINPW